ncbi:TPA_asm: G [Peat soil associated betacytorhabdovirus 2]|jgi:hypothetical protein|nr:TPA_asm: G [Peat soil associated betacytorhabdovirus 2]
MIHPLIISVLLSLLSMISATDLHEAQRIPTLVCDEKNKFPYSAVHCISDCTTNNLDLEKVNVTIYKPLIETDYPLARCRRISRTTRFVQTWTFSKLPPVISLKYLQPSIKACRGIWNSKCKESLCLIKAPDLSPEYHWASETVTVDEYYTLDVSPTSIIINTNDDAKILTPEGLVDYSNLNKTNYDHSDVFIWNKLAEKDILKVCSLNNGFSTECTNTSSGMLLCKDLGMTLNVSTRLKSRECKIDIYHDKGLVYSLEGKGTLQQGQLSSDTETKVSRLIGDLKESLIIRDTNDCRERCLELENKRDKELFQLGGNIMMKTEDMYIKCFIDPTCHIEVPIVICGSDEIIRVGCSGYHRWINLSTTYTNTDFQCSNIGYHTHEEILKRHDLLVMNKNRVFWTSKSITISPFFLPGDYLNDHVELDRINLDSDELSSKSSSKMIKKSVNDNHWFIGYLKNLTYGLYKILHEIKTGIFMIIFTIICAYLVKLKLYQKKRVYTTTLKSDGITYYHPVVQI